jgi:hypothetical protein
LPQRAQRGTEIRKEINPKFEVRNPKQIRITKTQNIQNKKRKKGEIWKLWSFDTSALLSAGRLRISL